MDGRGVDSTADALGDFERALRRRVGQQHDELVAAIASGDVGEAELGLDREREMAQELVARAVAVGVVYRLQVVGIDHQHAGRAPVPRGLGEQAIGGDGEAADVQESRQVVGLREHLGAREAVADVGREHGGDVGDEQHRCDLGD